MHGAPHPRSGQTVKLKAEASHPQFANFGGSEFVIEDWHDRVMGGKTWMDCYGNPAAMVYGLRSGMNDIPLDNEVVYGKIGHFGHIVHVSEIE